MNWKRVFLSGGGIILLLYAALFIGRYQIIPLIIGDVSTNDPPTELYFSFVQHFEDSHPSAKVVETDFPGAILLDSGSERSGFVSYTLSGSSDIQTMLWVIPTSGNFNGYIYEPHQWESRRFSI